MLPSRSYSFATTSNLLATTQTQLCNFFSLCDIYFVTKQLAKIFMTATGKPYFFYPK